MGVSGVSIQGSRDAAFLQENLRERQKEAGGKARIYGNHEDPVAWSVPHCSEKSIAYVLPESRPSQGLTREEALFSNLTDVARLPRGAAYESADVPDNAYPDGRIADEAIRRLQSAKASRSEPFFLAVGFLKPHVPFCAPKTV